jgi:hypothetical protein
MKLCGMFHMLILLIYQHVSSNYSLFKNTLFHFVSQTFRYRFPVQQWIHINNEGYVFDAVDHRENSIVTPPQTPRTPPPRTPRTPRPPPQTPPRTPQTPQQQYHRRSIHYKIIVHTGNVSGAGTDSNVSIILYGNLGNTGSKPLKQKGRDLFEKNQTDEFIIESLELGKTNLLFVYINLNKFR